MTSLEIVELQNNGLTGEFPLDLSQANMPNLQYVNIANNSFEGATPVFVNCPRLEGLEFSQN